MTGQASTIYFFIGFSIFIFAAYKKMSTIPGNTRQGVEIEMIARKEMVYGQSQIKNALDLYFKSLFRSLMIAMLYVSMSSINFLLMLLSIRTNGPGSPSPLWQAVLLVFLIFSTPFIVFGLKMFDVKVLRKDTLERFNN